MAAPYGLKYFGMTAAEQESAGNYACQASLPFEKLT